MWNQVLASEFKKVSQRNVIATEKMLYSSLLVIFILIPEVYGLPLNSYNCQVLCMLQNWYLFILWFWQCLYLCDCTQLLFCNPCGWLWVLDFRVEMTVSDFCFWLRPHHTCKTLSSFNYKWDNPSYLTLSCTF